MMMGHRFERTEQGELHIHSYNRAQSIAIVSAGVISIVGPVAFVWFAIVSDIPAQMHALHLLLLILALLLIAGISAAMAFYIGARETLMLSRDEGVGRRRTQNFFGRRERIEAFKVRGPKRLELRRRQHAEPIYTQLWLVMRDGPEHRLTSNTVPVVPGSKRTDEWLREIAEYLEVPVPTEVVEEPAAGMTALSRPAPAIAPNTSTRRKQAKDKSPVAAHEHTDKIGVPGRILLTLIGAFTAVLGLIQAIGVVRGLFTGRLRYGGARPSSSFYWAEQPLSFSFNVLFGVGEVLILGFITWRCLRIALQGRMKAEP